MEQQPTNDPHENKARVQNIFETSLNIYSFSRLGKDFTPWLSSHYLYQLHLHRFIQIFTLYLIKALSLHFVIMVCSQNYGESA